jgi:hypothetical protein
MRGRFASFLVLLAVAFAPACAAGVKYAGHCRVVAGEKLLARSGGGAAICSEVESAIAARAPGARYSTEVSALSASRLAAKLVVDGKTLPEQNFAIMDRDLDSAAIKRFAQALAESVARASKP